MWRQPPARATEPAKNAAVPDHLSDHERSRNPDTDECGLVEDST